MAKALKHPPVVFGALVTVVVLDRELFEFDRIRPGTDRVEQQIPSPSRLQDRARRPVQGLQRGAVDRPVMRLALAGPIRFGLLALAAAAEASRPIRPLS